MEDADALACAVRVLTRRDHSVAELVRKLRLRKFSPVVIEGVLVRLKANGYLDDRRFAERWVEAAINEGRGYGVRLRLDLTRRGVSREIIEDVLVGISAAHDEEKTLLSLAERKFAAFDPATAPERERRRVMGYLKRRGFSTGAILRFFQCNDTD